MEMKECRHCLGILCGRGAEEGWRALRMMKKMVGGNSGLMWRALDAITGNWISILFSWAFWQMFSADHWSNLYFKILNREDSYQIRVLCREQLILLLLTKVMFMYFLSLITHICYMDVSLIMVVRVSLEPRHSIRDAEIEFQKSIKPVRVYYIY